MKFSVFLGVVVVIGQVPTGFAQVSPGAQPASLAPSDTGSARVSTPRPRRPRVRPPAQPSVVDDSPRTEQAARDEIARVRRFMASYRAIPESMRGGIFNSSEGQLMRRLLTCDANKADWYDVWRVSKACSGTLEEMGSPGLVAQDRALQEQRRSSTSPTREVTYSPELRAVANRLGACARSAVGRTVAARNNADVAQGVIDAFRETPRTLEWRTRLNEEGFDDRCPQPGQPGFRAPSPSSAPAAR